MNIKRLYRIGRSFDRLWMPERSSARGTSWDSRQWICYTCTCIEFFRDWFTFLLHFAGGHVLLFFLERRKMLWHRSWFLSRQKEAAWNEFWLYIRSTIWVIVGCQQSNLRAMALAGRCRVLFIAIGWSFWVEWRPWRGIGSFHFEWVSINYVATEMRRSAMRNAVCLFCMRQVRCNVGCGWR